jgi:hypothetical protein
VLYAGTVPDLASSSGQFGSIDMGGTFTVMKNREGVGHDDEDANGEAP